MIGIDGYWFVSSCQVMFPFPEGNVNGHQLFFMDVLVSLSWPNVSGMEGERIVSFSIKLRQYAS